MSCASESYVQSCPRSYACSYTGRFRREVRIFEGAKSNIVGSEKSKVVGRQNFFAWIQCLGIPAAGHAHLVPINRGWSTWQGTKTTEHHVKYVICSFPIICVGNISMIEIICTSFCRAFQALSIHVLEVQIARVCAWEIDGESELIVSVKKSIYIVQYNTYQVIR
jgi:hypothetical protein